MHGWLAGRRLSLTYLHLSVSGLILLKYRIPGISRASLSPCASHSAALLDGVPSKTPVCRFETVLNSPFSVLS